MSVRDLLGIVCVSVAMAGCGSRVDDAQCAEPTCIGGDASGSPGAEAEPADAEVEPETAGDDTAIDTGSPAVSDASSDVAEASSCSEPGADAGLTLDCSRGCAAKCDVLRCDSSPLLVLRNKDLPFRIRTPELPPLCTSPCGGAIGGARGFAVRLELTGLDISGWTAKTDGPWTMTVYGTSEACASGSPSGWKTSCIRYPVPYVTLVFLTNDTGGKSSTIEIRTKGTCP